MGREVRMVPPGWEHPRDGKGRYIPLIDGDFDADDQEWTAGRIKYAVEGKVRDYDAGVLGWKDKPADAPYKYADWSGRRPDPCDYMPKWSKAEAAHFQMYETCTEGTPISPPMESPESLAKWLSENNASAFGGATATYDQWIAMIGCGWAPSGATMGGVLMSGVEFVAKEK